MQASRHISGIRRLLGVIAVLVILAAWISTSESGGRLDDYSADYISAWVVASGIWGPATVIGLMIVAVVVSPLPSAPIALAAGAAFGHYAGTVYVAIGAEVGAIVAFWLARFLGRDLVERVAGSLEGHTLLGSQNALTLTVFVSRILPFLSFDIVSYAAGLSSLHLWRFAVATLAGILPASFLLAHVGQTVLQGTSDDAALLALGLGIATALPLLVLALRRNLIGTGRFGSEESGE
ncbi:VTT domain-containing protein [Seohaeicola saemankumensis]|nr:VTT domain-containing protein [Seohaeicola saemankumensis]MCA0871394.1 VTT domain-containing protein [Seohaeicola saemankumensis]